MIFVTHGHGDTWGSAAAIARRTGAPVCCTADLADAVFVCGGGMRRRNLGGTVRLSFAAPSFFRPSTAAVRRAVLPAASFLRWGQEDLSRRRHGLMTDMTLLADEDIDVALLPIGDFYTMGPADASGQ